MLVLGGREEGGVNAGVFEEYWRQIQFSVINTCGLSLFQVFRHGAPPGGKTGKLVPPPVSQSTANEF